MHAIIDAHHHLWQYDPDLYGWIGPEMRVLKQDFTVDMLRDEMEGVGADASIAVQARQDAAETEWLLDVAQETPEIIGVIGWTDLCAPDVDDALGRLASKPALVGIRHVLQDEPDDSFMLRNDFNRGVARLRDNGLAYDILIYERHLPMATAFVDSHPDQLFVLDHVAKPSIKKGEMHRWRSGITELAEREHCYCKLSGLITEADWAGWTEVQLRPFLDAVLDAFGPERLMFGSDWPVCLLAGDYAAWYHLLREFASELSSTEQERIFGGTAAEAYGLAVIPEEPTSSRKPPRGPKGN